MIETDSIIHRKSVPLENIICQWANTCVMRAPALQFIFSIECSVVSNYTIFNVSPLRAREFVCLKLYTLVLNSLQALHFLCSYIRGRIARSGFKGAHFRVTIVLPRDSFGYNFSPREISFSALRLGRLMN